MDAADHIRIRRITPGDGLVLRDLRLRSIVDSPGAFGQPLPEARARPASEWQREARRAAHGDERAWLFAEGPSGPIGIVQGRRRRPSTLLLFSMWVDPATRRHGVGRLLVSALETWARRSAASETVLWVMAGNQEAIEFYRRLGFAPLSRGRDAESGARFGAVAMRRPIDDTVDPTTPAG